MSWRIDFFISDVTPFLFWSVALHLFCLRSITHVGISSRFTLITSLHAIPEAYQRIVSNFYLCLFGLGLVSLFFLFLLRSR